MRRLTPLFLKGRVIIKKIKSHTKNRRVKPCEDRVTKQL